MIIPQDGMDEEYDASKKEIADINKAANRYLEKYEKMLGCKVNKSIYTHSDEQFNTPNFISLV